MTQPFMRPLQRIGTVTLIVFLISLFIVDTALGVAGAFLWKDELHIPNGSGVGNAVVAVGGKVFVGGSTIDSADNQDFLFRVYDEKTGQLLWQDSYDQSGEVDSALAVAVGQGRVFAAGITAANSADDADLLVRAYDAKKGLLLWQTFYDENGGWDVASSVVTANNLVFVAGQVTISSTDTDFIVLALNVKTGEILWYDVVDEAAKFDTANSIATDGKRVFAAGSVNNSSGNDDFFVRAYDSKNGTLLWEDQVDRLSTAGDQAFAITVDKGTVFTTGKASIGTNSSVVLTRAYDAKSGNLIWENNHPRAGYFDKGVAIAVEGGQVFVAGSSRENILDHDFLMRAYNAKTGELLWMDDFDLSSSEDFAHSIAADSGQVFATGSGINSAGNHDFLIRTYDGKTGNLLWQEQLDGGDGSDSALAISVGKGRVLVTGFSQESDTGSPGTHRDYVVRAYSIK